MKISLNWVKEYTGVDLKIDALVEKIGAQLGAVEEVTNLGERYQHIVIAEVVSCVSHPDADKLHICKIDDGKAVKDIERDENGYVQVVCGAPNVRTGMMVAWLPPGAIVPNTYHTEPFVLGARELRGVMSNGMLASAHELALGDSHDGLLELNSDDAKPGADFAKTYKLNDYIIDVENKMFTHRPDCFGILGLAREISGITHQEFVSPKWYQKPLSLSSEHPKPLPFKVENELPELVPRFTAISMRVEQNGPSPVWMQTYLARVGIRPISTVVDITNYLMYLTGQPLHAYDYDKLKSLSAGQDPTIVVRHPMPKEKLTLLGGKTIELRKEAILIAAGTQPIGLGGVMGGADTEVDPDTRNIIIECANFNMYSIRRTSMEHGLFTDASSRFNKGQSPRQNAVVLARAAEMYKQLAGGSIASDVIDTAEALRPDSWPAVDVDAAFINARLGLELTAHDMTKLLENVEFDVQSKADSLTVGAPFWRTDIEIPEDIVEEIGRLYGYDHLPLELPKRDLTPAPRDGLLEIKSRVRGILSTAGANEVLSYSFVHGDLLQKAGQETEQAFELSNALSPDLQHYRLTLTPSLLDKVYANIRAGYPEFALFEIGKSHNKAHGKKTKEEVPEEFEMIALTYAARDAKARRAEGSAYYQAKALLDYLAGQLGLELDYSPITDSPDYAVTKPFDLKRSAYVADKNSGVFIGIVGEYTPSVRHSLKLPKFSSGFEIGTSHLMEAAAKKAAYVSLPKFPKVQQDITLRVPSGTVYQPLTEFLQAAAPYPEDSHHYWEPVSIYEPKDKTHKNITLRLTIACYGRTLTAEAVNKVLDTAAAAAAKKFGAERI